MPQATSKARNSQTKNKSRSQTDDDGGDAGPSAQERAESGIKLAQHLQTAMTGGKIRQAFALWGAAKQLRVAAAGTGTVVKKYPLATALIGGGLAATAIYLAAKSAAAASDEQDADAGDGESDEEEDSQARSEERIVRRRR
jgi:hypothetical protein